MSSAITNAAKEATARMGSRKFDLVLWGATGYTGKLVAQYLASRYENHPAHEEGLPSGGDGLTERNLCIALAGRNRQRLEELRSSLALMRPSWANAPVLVHDLTNQACIDSMVEKTRVMVALVGPFSQYGTPVVDACVRLGTHYVDITGEVPWTKSIIDKYHTRAETAGIKLVPHCGFDSVPSDIGTLMAERAFALKYTGQSPKIVKGSFLEATGGLSGGTIATMVSHIEKLNTRPNLLNPAGVNQTLDHKDQNMLAYDADFKRWTLPFLMASINTRLVRRSIALRGQQYRYDENASHKGLPRAALQFAFQFFFFLMFQFAMTRNFLLRILPSPGEGPSEKEVRTGHFNAQFIAKKMGTGQSASVCIKGPSAYQLTAVTVAEAAIVLALGLDSSEGDSDDNDNPAVLPKALPAGVLTASTALGPHYISRLRRGGVTFNV
ncbi:hypothetical protein H696_01424 [Fonticula alba]|uniref:Uncharacterized protein n=1 Tax=Fonticula alba TaxID=691883 RepID=A0A058ZEX2_FONAL|nr:hypothetical protein H696_01424 [Fonticula alba]KCV72017.1 hypothetical protein H696_01424 [Fonticula alba]|eukprot:XP_009493595.1 hypothetical protein H696_01424 [Fonticula alba]